MRARHVVDDMISEVWIQGKDPSVGLGMKLEIIKTLTKIADLEPKANQLVQQGSGFSLVINLPAVGEQPGRTIEMNKAETSSIDAEPIPSMGMAVPDMGTMNRVVNSTMNSALELPEDWDE